MGARKEALILKAIEERQQFSGRHLLADATRAVDGPGGVAAGTQVPGLDVVPVGSLRRGAETCGDVDLLAVGAGQQVLEIFTTYPLVERVLGRGDTKASVLIRGGLQADLRAVAADERGAAMQYFTGSKAHNIVLRDRALERGWRLNEYGLFQAADQARIAGDTEEGIYARSGPGVGAAGAAREPRVRSRPRRHGAAPSRSRPPICAATCTCTRRRPTGATRWR